LPSSSANFTVGKALIPEEAKNAQPHYGDLMVLPNIQNINKPDTFNNDTNLATIGQNLTSNAGRTAAAVILSNPMNSFSKNRKNSQGVMGVSSKKQSQFGNFISNVP